MTGRIFTAAVAAAVVTLAGAAAYAELTDVADKTRNSEAVIFAEVTSVEPGGAKVKLLEALKGGAETKAIKYIGREAGAEGDDGYRKGEKCVFFIGEIHNDVGVLYGGISSRVDSKQSDLNEMKKVIKDVLALETAKGKEAKTSQLKKMLASTGFQSRYISLDEIILRSADYDAQSLHKLVTPLLKEKNTLLRKKAMLAEVRIYDQKANGTSRDNALLNMLIGMLEDENEEIRQIAFIQFKSHSGNRNILFDANTSPGDRKAQIEKIKKWMNEGKDKNVETEFE